MRESLARLKANGRKLGRPQGAKSKFLKLDCNQIKIFQMLEQGIPKTHIAKIMSVDRNTLYRFLNERYQNKAVVFNEFE